MKILTGNGIREADRITALKRGIDGLQLMEEASRGLAAAIARIVRPEATAGMPLRFLIGKGNNGGDGLAVARILSGGGYRCEVVLTSSETSLTEEAAANLRRLPAEVAVLHARDVMERDGAIACRRQTVVDAVLGTGVRGSVREPLAGMIRSLNASGAYVISVDIPSGLPTEPPEEVPSWPALTECVVRADVTLCVGFPKLSLLLPETGNCGGRIVTVPLDLDPDYIVSAGSPYSYEEEQDIRSILFPRAKFVHKGDYGHALLVCGSQGMPGAAVLAASGALRSGCGLVTVHLPGSERLALHCNCPSAMVDSDPEGYFSALLPDVGKFSSVGCGCGLGMRAETVRALGCLLESFRRPMVLDADALNIIAARPEMMSLVPPGSVLTPHPGELRRLIGEWKGPYDRFRKVSELAGRLDSCVLVKGAHTAVVSPDGHIAFNSTGNPGMAKGGSGDVLAGLLTGLLASGYASYDAARLGVWLHGRAGDAAAERYGLNAMCSKDIADFLPDAFMSIEKTR